MPLSMWKDARTHISFTKALYALKYSGNHAWRYSRQSSLVPTAMEWSVAASGKKIYAQR